LPCQPGLRAIRAGKTVSGTSLRESSLSFPSYWGLHKLTTGHILLVDAISIAILMYHSAPLLKTVTWLLAAAIAVQPVTAFSCGCGGGERTSGSRSSGPRHCCCCGNTGQPCSCCGSSHGGAIAENTQRSCCRRDVTRDVPATAGVCHCSSRAPQPSQPATPESAPSHDQVASSFHAYVAAADVPTVHRERWAINPSTAFVSASEHCIALCKLLF
jgi:hypothetical protein